MRKCVEDGETLLSYCAEQDELKQSIEDLNAKWSSVGKQVNE